MHFIHRGQSHCLLLKIKLNENVANKTCPKEFTTLAIPTKYYLITLFSPHTHTLLIVVTSIKASIVFLVKSWIESISCSVPTCHWVSCYSTPITSADGGPLMHFVTLQMTSQIMGHLAET